MNYTNKTSVVIKWYRFERWLFLHKASFLAKIVFHIMQLVFGCTIPYSAYLGNNVNIAHFHGIVIHHCSEIGDGTVIYQNTTFGGNKGKGGPIVGKNCIIGAGACILGPIKIGDNVKVGANAVVIQDVPSNCTVVGVPGRIIHREDVQK